EADYLLRPIEHSREQPANEEGKGEFLQPVSVADQQGCGSRRGDVGRGEEPLLLGEGPPGLVVPTVLELEQPCRPLEEMLPELPLLESLVGIDAIKQRP